MKGSLAASFGLHAAILAAALVALPNPKHDVMPVEAITVDISNIADANKLMATAKDAEKPVEVPAPKKAEVVKKVDETLKVAEEEKKAAKEAKAPPPPPPPKPEPEPKKEEAKKEEPPPPDPDAMAELLKKTIDEPPPPKKEEPKKKAEEKPKPVKKPEKKPEKATPKLDTDKLAALLNDDALLDKENEEKTTNASEALTDGEPAPGERDLQGKDQALSATTISAFAQRIRECWVIPPGAREGNITVKVRIQMNPDGSVAGDPQVMNGPGDFLFDTTARSTVAAILGCQNYDFLPPEQYDVWKDLVLNFNPNMFADATPTQ
jgi:outer membrane biosynthesis protein TonB